MEGLSRINWARTRQIMEEGWLPFALRTAQAAAREARTLKQITDPVARTVAASQAHTLATRAQLTTRRGLERILQEASARNWSEEETKRALGGWAGVGPTDASRLAERYDQALTGGADARDAMRELGRRAGRTVRQRAEMMAITEATATDSDTRMRVWDELKRSGSISPASRKIWVLSINPCRICQAIEKEGPVPLDGVFFSPLQSATHRAPPSHPRCECGVKLLPAPLGSG